MFHHKIIFLQDLFLFKIYEAHFQKKSLSVLTIGIIHIRPYMSGYMRSPLQYAIEIEVVPSL